MDYIYLKARAKINLALDIVGKREDGFHDLSMVMQTLYLHDTILIKKTDTNKIELVTNLFYLPTNEKNLVYKAADTFLKTYNINQGLYIKIKKNIPVSAGLGGGSSDCAATLIGLRNLFGLNISNKELAKIGKELGADVPYCIYRGTMKAEGIGEILTPLPNHPKVTVLLVKPDVNISTASIFKDFDKERVFKRPNINKIIGGLEKNDLKIISDGFCNVLESVTELKCPIIKELKNIMIEKGALGSLMSGSGPTVFGYFRNKNQAVEAADYIGKKYPKIKEIFITNIFNPQKRND